MKKKLTVFIATVFCLANFGSALASSSTSAVTQEAYSVSPVHAWTGLHAYTIGVRGFYDSNGTSITSYGTVRPIIDTSGPWSSSNRFSEWASSTNNSGTAYGEAYFILGVSTTWVELGFQSRTDSDTAIARP